jgi:polar amino acid transport system substrate-binding protein
MNISDTHTQQHTRHRLIRAAAAAGILLVAGTGCSDMTGDSAPDTTVLAPDTTVPASEPAPDCGNPVASFDPMTPTPDVGAMPDGSHMATIAERGRLIVGVSADTLLFGARNPFSGQIEGFDIDMLHEVADAILGDRNKIEYRVITYADRIPALQNGDVDIVAHTMTINCKRWDVISFSTEYFSAGQKVLVAAGSDANSITDLDGKRVCAPEGSTNIDNLAAYPDVIAVGKPDITDCLVAFQQGAVDAITGDDTVLAGFAAMDPYGKVVGDRFTDEPYGLGISQEHPEFVSFVNGVLADMRADGRWTAIYEKWLGDFGPVPEPPTAIYGRQP